MDTKETCWSKEELDYFAISEYDGVLTKYYNDGRVEVIKTKLN